MDVRPATFWRSHRLSAEAGLVHAVTQVPMNMALTVGADAKETAARRRAVCDALSLSFERLTVGEQVHGDRIAVVTGPRIGRGRDAVETRINGVDGLVTDEIGVPLMVLGADCALVLVYDPDRYALGVAHAGWRGTAKGVVRSLVRHLAASYGCRCEALLAVIGPCSGACCYEVREDVASAFAASGQDTAEFLHIREGGMYLDLVRANALQLAACGVPMERIEASGICTICDQAYYSHRRAPGAGHGALIAALRGL